jgi:hypothetical protein
LLLLQLLLLAQLLLFRNLRDGRSNTDSKYIQIKRKADEMIRVEVSKTVFLSLLIKSISELRLQL